MAPPRKVKRALNANILIHLEEELAEEVDGHHLRRTVGGIFIPDGAHESAMAIGKIEAVGPGEWCTTSRGKEWFRPVCDVVVGMRVLFIKFLAKTETAKRAQHALGQGRFFVREDDLLCEVGDDVRAADIVG